MITTQQTKNEEIKNKFMFHTELNNNTELFFCSCGNVIHKDKNTEIYEFKISVDLNAVSESDLFDSMILNIQCPNCKIDYSLKQNSGLIQNTDVEFIEVYSFDENENNIKLLKQRFKGVYENNELTVKSSESYILLDKTTKTLSFQDFDKKEEVFSLDRVKRIVEIFLDPNECKFSDQLFELHTFLNRLANFVSDSQNFDVINQLMVTMSGLNNRGFDTIKKVLVIFLGIICYPSLSTIALTKGTIFLYDLLDGCKLPTIQELSEVKATSPLKIFNALINYKNEEIEKEIKSSNTDQGYEYVTKDGRKVMFKYDAKRFDQELQTNKNQVGEVSLKGDNDELINKHVSPYIYNTIQNFDQYLLLIKYTKFVSYDELIRLVQRYNIDVLTNLIQSIEFRADMGYNRVVQIIEIGISSLKRWNKIRQQTDIQDLKFMRGKIAVNEINTDIILEDLELEYTRLQSVDLTDFDDSLRMIRILGWDPNKEFYRFKTIDEIEEYHDLLVSHFNMLTDEEKNNEFVSFVQKFEGLEDDNFEDKLQVKLVRTASDLINFSKELRNCGSSYVNRVSEGQYIMCKVIDIDPQRPENEHDLFMCGFKVNKYGECGFDSIKTYLNKFGSDRFKENIISWLETKEIPYSEDISLKLGTMDRKSV